MLFESSKAQHLSWIGSSSPVCQSFGPGLLLARHFTAFIVMRPLQLEKTMTILAASKSQSLDDLFEFRCSSEVMFVWHVGGS